MYRKASSLIWLWVALCCLSCRAPEDDDGGAAPSALDRQDMDDSWVAVDSGPWGTLEYRRFFLPLPKIWREAPPRNEPVVWHLPKISPALLQEKIATGPLTDLEKKSWRETCRIEAKGDGVDIHPSPEFRWMLLPESRTKLYQWLAKVTSNEAQVFPFSFPANAQKEWFQDCHLRKELIDAIDHFLYPVGTAVCFADLDLLEEYLDSPEERAELLAVLHRQPYCDLRLRLNQNTDIKSLSLYWGEWQRVERVHRKLKRAIETQREPALPLSQIIPSLPRSLLNTYPSMPRDLSQPQPDCYWTAFNFFNLKPDAHFSEAAYIEEVIKNYHDRVEGSPQYGDIVLLHDATGRPIHAAVYLAADFVYTKNGGHATKPWAIMKMADMKAAYPLQAPLQKSFYRWNPYKNQQPFHMSSTGQK